MELSQIIPHIEALIFASDKPLTNLDLVELLNNALAFIDDRATLDQVEAAVEGIREKYATVFYAFELKQSGGGWQFLTKKEFHKTVAQLNGDKFLKRLSNAALETLAIIAYKQPITKSEIESIRGVNCDYAVQKLLEKDLVIISGRNEDAVGKPLIYNTSKSFMDYFGINSRDDLPKISEVMMEELVKATIINGVQREDDTSDSEVNNKRLTVSETGEILENNAELNNSDPEASESAAPLEADVDLANEMKKENGPADQNEEQATGDKQGVEIADPATKDNEISATDKQVKDEVERSDS
jgi:segregation and condensation protein B